MDFTFKERLELNESFREFSRKHFPLLEEKETTEKNILQDFLCNKITFSHNIVVEPTPYHPIPFDELNERFRKITFDMCKKYLRSKYFGKFIPEDKFWIFGNKQGDGITEQKHYHLLLHSPMTHKISIWEDLIFPFISKSKTNPRTGKMRKCGKYYRNKFHIGADDLDYKFLIYAEPVRTHTGSVRYNTRKVQPRMKDEEDCFIIGLCE